MEITISEIFSNELCLILNLLCFTRVMRNFNIILLVTVVLLETIFVSSRPDNLFRDIRDRIPMDKKFLLPTFGFDNDMLPLREYIDRKHGNLRDYGKK